LRVALVSGDLRVHPVGFSIESVLAALWARALRAVPNSRLFRKAAQLVEDSLRDDVLRHFAAHTICEERLILEGLASRLTYLAAYHRVDIARPLSVSGRTVSAQDR
jgi:predicted O-linked N-acetylglucosamine transferase (SPINDLY family)